MNKLKLFYIIVFIIGIIIPFIFIPYGFSHQDETYIALGTADYKIFPLAFFSYYVAHIWTLLFADSLISLRYLAVITSLITIALPTFYFYFKTKQKELSLFIFGISSLIWYIALFEIFLYDTISNLFIVCTAVVVFLYIENRSMMKVIILALGTALAVCSRFPNVFIIPFVCIIMITLYFQSKKYSKSTLFLDLFSYIGLSCFFVFLITILLYGDLQNYIGSLNYYKTEGLKSHGLTTLLLSYFSKGCINILCLCTIITFYFCFILSDYKINRNQTETDRYLLTMTKRDGHSMWSILIKAASILFMFSFMTKFIFNQILASIMLFAIVYMLFVMNKNQRKATTISMLSLILFAIIPCAGSNSGTDRMLSFSVFPLLLPLLIPTLGKTTKQYILCMIAAFVLYLPVKVFTKIQLNSTENLLTATETLTIPKLQGIRTTPSIAKRLNEVYRLASIEKEKGRNLIFYSNDGIDKNVFDYVFNVNRSNMRQEFYICNASDCINGIGKQVAANKNCSIIAIDTHENNGTEKMVKSLGYTVYKQGNHVRILTHEQ